MVVILGQTVEDTRAAEPLCGLGELASPVRPSPGDFKPPLALPVHGGHLADLARIGAKPIQRLQILTETHEQPLVVGPAGGHDVHSVRAQRNRPLRHVAELIDQQKLFSVLGEPLQCGEMASVGRNRR